MGKMKIKEYTGWTFYYGDCVQGFGSDNPGRWCYYFTNQQYADLLCRAAVDSDVATMCKCENKSKGSVYFYVHTHNMAEQKRFLEFFIGNNLVQKTKKGNLFNVSFKSDKNPFTSGHGFTKEGSITVVAKLDSFIDLSTGEWLLPQPENTGRNLEKPVPILNKVSSTSKKGKKKEANNKKSVNDSTTLKNENASNSPVPEWEEQVSLFVDSLIDSLLTELEAPTSASSLVSSTSPVPISTEGNQISLNIGQELSQCKVSKWKQHPASPTSG